MSSDVVIDSLVDVAFIGKIFNGVTDLLFGVSAFKSVENIGDWRSVLKA